MSATPLVFLFFHWEIPSGKEVKVTVPFYYKVCCSWTRTVNATILLVEAQGRKEARLFHLPVCSPSHPAGSSPCPRHPETPLPVGVIWWRNHPQPWTISLPPSPLLSFRHIFPCSVCYEGPNGSFVLKTLPFADQEGLADSVSWSSRGTSLIIPCCLLRGCYGYCIWLSGHLSCHSVHPPSDDHGFLTSGSLFLVQLLSPGNIISI